MDAVDIPFYSAINETAPVKPPTGLVSAFVEQHRIMPTGTPFPGFWNNERTPYLIEPMDDMGPYSPVTREIVVKAAQMGFTAAIENIIGYYIKIAPCEILYVTATEPMLKKWAMKRLDPMIDSIGCRKLFMTSTERAKGKGSGDMTLLKLFVGGALNMASAQSGASIRSDSIRILLRDEISAAPVLLRTGEGDWLEVSGARTSAWGDRAKIYDQSTPGVEGECQITKEYQHGDKRIFLVPCPHCGVFQELRWGNDHTQHGIKADTHGGRVERAYYQCDHCHDAIFNHHKTQMLAQGYWHPTAKPDSPKIRSRRINGLYRPVGMSTWTDMLRKYLIALDDPDKMAGFNNLELGRAHRPVGSRPMPNKVYELRTGYHSGTIPDGVLFLTAGIDVQEGSKTDKANPPRLEMEILGHGDGFRTWSIEYRVFKGDVDDPAAGAWAELTKHVEDGGFIFQRDDGLEFGVRLTLVDSGNQAAIVYQFCRGWEGVFPSKGRRWAARRKKNEDPNVDTAIQGSDYKRFSVTQMGGGEYLYIVSTIFYKDRTYTNLKVPRQETGEQRRGFCSFPYDYPDKYFDMLISEDKLADGSYHSGGRRNEALDCRVLNLCAGDIFLGAEIKNLQAYYRDHGWSQVECEANINHQFVLEQLTQATVRRLTG
jgi:phage terminase large subunit GpA-like protein